MATAIRQAGIVGQDDLLRDRSVLDTAIKAKHSVVLINAESCGKTLILDALRKQYGAETINAHGTPSEFKSALGSVASGALFTNIAYVVGLENADSGKRAQIEQFIDDGGAVWGEARDLARFEASTRDRFTIVKARTLDEDDLKAIAQQTVDRAWTDPALDALASVAFPSGRSAARLATLAATRGKKEPISVDDIRDVAAQVAVQGDGKIRGEIISAWIKSMRLGNVADAMYWLHAARANGESIPYMGRRLAIFAAEDGWDPQAITVGNSIGLWTQQGRDGGNDWNPVIWGTTYMCGITKFWETKEGRAYEKARTDAKKLEVAGELVAAKLKFPSYALDRHTKVGQAIRRTRQPIDERFSGTFPGRAHMCAYFEKHGQLDPESHDRAIEDATVNNADLHRAFGERA